MLAAISSKENQTNMVDCLRIENGALTCRHKRFSNGERLDSRVPSNGARNMSNFLRRSDLREKAYLQPADSTEYLPIGRAFREDLRATELIIRHVRTHGARVLYLSLARAGSVAFLVARTSSDD